MTKESLTNYARTREFFKAALQEDAHLKNPPTVQEKDWIRQRNVSGSYYASDKSMLNIGRVYGITKEGVRRSVHKFVERLWKNSSENTRERFPLGLLPIAKPRRSKVRPTNLEIANVPKKEPNFYQRIANAQDRVELQILLDNVTATFYRTHSRGDNPLFLSLTRVAKKDFRFHRRDVILFHNCLVQAGIPVGRASELVRSGPNAGKIQHYYFIRREEEKRARQAFLKDLLLKRLLK